jgi:hypothetical protein
MASPAHQARDEPELPDLGIIVRSFQSIATELPKLYNVPAFNLGAEILNEIRGIRQEMRQEMRRMNEKIDRFDSRFKAMYMALLSFLPHN